MGGFSLRAGEQAGALKCKNTKGGGWTLGLGASAGDEGEMAIHFEPGDLGNFQCAQFEFFGDGPARDEADAEADFDSGLDRFGGIEIHDAVEQLEFEAGILKSEFDDAARAGALFAHQQFRRQQLSAGHVIGFESGRHDQDQFILHEGFGANAAVACRSFDESDREFVVEEKMDNLAGIAAVERELDARMLFEKGSDQARENVLRDRGGDAERQLTGDFAILRTELLLGLGDDGRDFLGVDEKKGSLRSEGDAIAGAIEEANAEIVFERFDLERDGGLCEEKVFGCLAKVQMFGNRAKDFETKIFQLSHGMIIH